MIVFPVNLDLEKNQGKLGIARLDSGRNGSPCGKLGHFFDGRNDLWRRRLANGQEVASIYLQASDRASGSRFDERDFRVGPRVKPSEKANQAIDLGIVLS
jgi:hypothetical protein